MAKGTRSDLVVVGFSPAPGGGPNPASGSDKLGDKVPVYTKGRVLAWGQVGK